FAHLCRSQEKRRPRISLHPQPGRRNEQLIRYYTDYLFTRQGHPENAWRRRGRGAAGRRLDASAHIPYNSSLAARSPPGPASMSKPQPTTSATPPTAEGFLKPVLRSGLLARETLQAQLRSLPLDRRSEPEAVAEHLVKAGQLTRFQARKLFAGTALGLALGPF